MTTSRADAASTAAASATEAGTGSGEAAGRWWRVGAVVATAVGVAHALVVSVRYHVGSFDDDASYVSAARAIASGHGLTSRLAGGYPLIGVYPPGYPAILSVFAFFWRSSVADFRALSLAMFVAVFPLTWIYLRRRGVSEPYRLGLLALLALNPVLATYATMIMAEVPFVVVLVLVLLAAERWQKDAATLTWAGVGTVVGVADLVWMKEAGFGLAVGLVAWFAWRRQWSKTVAAAVAPAALIAPLLIARALAGANLIGSRYSNDLGKTGGGVVGRLVNVAPDALRQYLYTALPHSILPTGMRVLEHHFLLSDTLRFISLLSAPLVLVGFVLWWRRHRDASCFIVPAYLAETLMYPYTNERRVVLVLPVIIAWYVLGVGWLFRELASLARWGRGAAQPVRERLIGVALPLVLVLLAAIELAAQFPRDYLFDQWGYSSAPGGSGYMALLHRMGPPSSVVETDYLWTTALETGHRTANTAYLQTDCPGQSVVQALQADDAGFVLTSSMNGGGLVDDACIVPVVAGLPGAVRLYRSDRDQASVFELVGPGTGHPGLRDLTPSATLEGSATVVEVPEPSQADGDVPGLYAEVSTLAGASSFTWSWPQPVSLSQVSLGGAGAVGVATRSVQVAVRDLSGTWRVLDQALGSVGPGARSQFLVVSLPTATPVTSIRVTVAAAAGTGAFAAVHYFRALGPTQK